jgi:SAM-dependent methyltransferase
MEKDELAKEYVVSFYDCLLRRFGDSPQALGWNPNGQVHYYWALLDIGDLRGSKVLDFGCGKGDFYGFLKELGIEVDYTGLDINSNLIDLARKKYPDTDFRTFDISKEDFTEDYDYIFICGVFNLKVHGIEDTLKEVLKKLFARCKVALAINALSSYAKKKDFLLHYTQPEGLFTFAMQHLSSYVSLRHDRLKESFTIFVYKDINLNLVLKS